MTETGKIVVLGCTGQVGSALLALLGDQAVGLEGLVHFDLSDPDSVLPHLDRLQPGVVLNATAYTNVEKAETEQDLAWRCNGEGPGVMARWCAAHNVPFVHYSTDYVFSESQGRPHLEDDPVGPGNAYGRSKLEGERQVQAAGGRYLIFRTSWVYDAFGVNFLRTMARLGAERDTLRVVDDQQGAPTYAPHLAAATIQALDAAGRMDAFPTGVYHLCNQGITTWHEFAVRIFEGLRARGVPLKIQTVTPIPTSEYPTAVNRPLDSRLDTGKARQVLGVSLPPWKQGLEECLEVYTHASHPAPL